MTSASGDEFEVADVRSKKPYIFHVGTLQTGSIKIGDEMKCSVRRACSSSHRRAGRACSTAIAYPRASLRFLLTPEAPQLPSDAAAFL